MVMNLGRQSQGTLTFLSSPTTGSALVVAFAECEVREASLGRGGCDGSDGGGSGASGVRSREGYGNVDVLYWGCGAGA